MNLQLNADRFTGSTYVNLYDKYRPSPPLELIHQSLNYCNRKQAETVVDLGCGTGLSTAVWSAFSTQVVGIEPSLEMIALAKANHAADNIQYQAGYAHDIPMGDQSADIISCSQSFHWMEPTSSLKDIHRVLKRKGVLVIYDVIWPPSVNAAFEKAYRALFTRVDTLTKRLNEPIAHHWAKSQHLENVIKSGGFSFIKEAYYHKTDPLGKEQFIGIALSQGGLEALRKRGCSEKAIEIDTFRKAIAAAEEVPYAEITYNYRVIFAIK